MGEEDDAGAVQHLDKAFKQCMKKQYRNPPAVCMEGWGAEYLEWNIKRTQLALSDECKKEAQVKYDADTEAIDACSKEIMEKEKAEREQRSESQEEEEEEDDDRGRGTYVKILMTCAGVSRKCAKQNAFVMAERAQREAMAALGMDMR